MTIANTPAPPYYAVIFTSVEGASQAGYAETAERMMALARQQPGFLGVESVHEGDTGVTVSYWKDLDSIRNWKMNAEHRAAQKNGMENWYSAYTTRIALVEKDYSRAL